MRAVSAESGRNSDRLPPDARARFVHPETNRADLVVLVEMTHDLAQAFLTVAAAVGRERVQQMPRPAGLLEGLQNQALWFGMAAQMLDDLVAPPQGALAVPKRYLR